MTIIRKYPIGAEVQAAGGVHFRVWAPRSLRVAVELYSPAGETSSYFAMESEPGGYFSLLLPYAQAGDLYKYRLEQLAELKRIGITAIEVTATTIEIVSVMSNSPFSLQLRR